MFLLFALNIGVPHLLSYFMLSEGIMSAFNINIGYVLIFTYILSLASFFIYKNKNTNQLLISFVFLFVSIIWVFQSEALSRSFR